jgi:ferredoxin-NADP reductase
MPINTFPITLEESFMITPKVKHFIFKCELTPPFNYLPGQFITIHFEQDGKQLKRSYSIANPPEQDNRIEFAASYFEGGPGTELLFNLQPGDILNIGGPFGRLTIKDEAFLRFILVATSTGITPYKAMLNKLGRRMEENPNFKVVVLQGVQKREDILYKNEFENFIKTYSNASFISCLSREVTPNEQEYEFRGYVQHAFPKLSLNPAEDIVYLCGNPGMIDDSFNYLKEQGFPVPQIIREKYISR